MTIRFGIGTTSANIIDLADLAIPYPLVQPDPFFETVELGDGSLRGIGGERITWSWGFLGPAYQGGVDTDYNNLREALRDYCPGASADIFIISPTNEAEAAKKYSGIMIWPFPETRQAADAKRRLDFSIEFRHLTPST